MVSSFHCGVKILCLAAGGGQQAPILAAAGGDVTVVDLSRKQLEQDAKVAERDGLSMEIIQGDMTDLSNFRDESFDLVINPVSNLFVKDIKPVWKEIARVLKNKGILIAGFANPALWIFDNDAERKGVLDVKHAIPSSTIDQLSEKEIQEFSHSKQTIEFAHTLEGQLQGQIDAGLLVTGFYEDDFGGSRIIDQYMKTLIATRAVKLDQRLDN